MSVVVTLSTLVLDLEEVTKRKRGISVLLAKEENGKKQKAA